MKSAQQFNLETIRALPGGDLKRDFDEVLKSLVKDCLARPSIDKTREVKLVVQVRPCLKQDGTCDDVKVDVQVASKAPAKIVPSYVMRANVHGSLLYQPDSPSDPSQPGLDFEE